MKSNFCRLTKPELERLKNDCNFTDEEYVIVGMLAGNKSYDEIAYKIKCSTATVGRRVRMIKDKVERGYGNMGNNENEKDVPKFTGRNVPVTEVAKLMGKDQMFIRQGIIRGILPIGAAFKKIIVDPDSLEERESTQYDFYISPKLLYEYTGIMYEEKE